MIEKSTVVGLYVTGLLVILVVVILLLKRCCECNGNLNDLLNGTLFEELGQQRSRIPEGRRRQILEDRRLLILTSVLHKKVLPKKHKPGAEADLHHGTSSSFDSSGYGISEMDTNTAGHGKSNITIESLRRYHSSRQENDVESDSSTIYTPHKCSICLERYKPGDEICWSKHPDCYHVFHLDCIMEWLMKSNECPLCRKDYLNSKGGVEVNEALPREDEDNIHV